MNSSIDRVECPIMRTLGGDLTPGATPVPTMEIIAGGRQRSGGSVEAAGPARRPSTPERSS